MAISPCLPHQRALKLNNDVVKVIQDHAQDYIDHSIAEEKAGRPGLHFDDIIERTAQDLGLPGETVARAFTEPKTMRKLTHELYYRQAVRRELVGKAKAYVEGIDDKSVGKWLQQVPYVGRIFRGNPIRRSLTTGHFAVFPVTHAGALLKRYDTALLYLRTVGRAYRYGLSKAAQEAAMSAMKRDPYYALARRGGLDINPDKGPTGVLYSKPGAAERSLRGWSALKPTRLELFKREWRLVDPKDVDTIDKQIEMSKAISEMINHSTGTLSPQEQGVLGRAQKLMFSPKLTESKISRGVVDPWETFKTIYDMHTGKQVSAAERHLAIRRLQNATKYAVTSMTYLAINQAILEMAGSQQKVNFTDYGKTDWLRYKAGGHVVYTRDVDEVIRLLGKIASISYVDNAVRGALTKGMDVVGLSKLAPSIRNQIAVRRGQTAQQAQAGEVAQYGEYKIDPDLQTAIELFNGEDVFGRPLPWSNKPGTKTRPKYTYEEYGWTKGPIPLSGASREIYDQMRKQGLSSLDATTFLKGAMAAATESLVGGMYPDPDVNP